MIYAIGVIARYMCLLGLLFTLTSCSGKTTVVLLPEDDGSVGQIEVRGEQSSQVINKPNNYTVVSGGSGAPAVAREMSSEEIEKRFSSALSVQPLKPAIFRLYFKSGTTELTGDYLRIIDEILAAIKDRYPSDISAIGHSDSIGSRSYNIKLSLQRATAVEKLIRETSGTNGPNVQAGEIDISSAGENDPAVETEDGVAEPLNRRVEVTVR